MPHGVLLYFKIAILLIWNRRLLACLIFRYGLVKYRIVLFPNLKLYSFLLQKFFRRKTSREKTIGRNKTILTTSTCKMMWKKKLLHTVYKFTVDTTKRLLAK